MDNTEHAVLRIQWIGGTSTEHSFAATDQSLRAIARFSSDAEPGRGRGRGRSDVRTDRRVPQPGGLPPAIEPRRPVHPGACQGTGLPTGSQSRGAAGGALAVDEWWVRDLADELGVGYNRFKEWVRKGYVHVRRVGSRGHLVIWADAEERVRLCRLRDHRRPGRSKCYPAELTRLKDRSNQK